MEDAAAFLRPKTLLSGTGTFFGAANACLWLKGVSESWLNMKHLLVCYFSVATLKLFMPLLLFAGLAG